MLCDRLLAACAMIHGSFRLPLVPAQPLELQPLPVVTMWAGHKIPPLIRGLKLPLDPGKPTDRRGRDHEHLAAMGKGCRAGLGQRDRIAFLVSGGRIGVNLIQKHITRGHRAQASG